MAHHTVLSVCAGDKIVAAGSVIPLNQPVTTFWRAWAFRLEGIFDSTPSLYGHTVKDGIFVNFFLVILRVYPLLPLSKNFFLF